MLNPFHEGELKIQRLAHQEAIAERTGGIIADRIMSGALPFLAQQSMAVFGSRDPQGRLWASILFGLPGFMNSADGSAVEFDLSRVVVERSDPFWRNIEANPAVGMLAIELATRRRIRINGQIHRPAPNRLHLSVAESFPNCPKYISRQIVKSIEAGVAQSTEFDTGGTLGPAQQSRLRRTDALFIATAHPTRGVDASHRGGNPGFVEVLDGKTFRIPDYPGNGMFNSFGNLAVDSAAGLAVPDFQHRRNLLLTGNAEIQFNAADPAGATGGTNRFLLFHINEWLEFAQPPAVDSERIDYSPFNPPVANPAQ
jgi:predicted pyridoxine 5'-phosphate oxidase superfamily flavin-nucleotide-binding protein